MSRAAAKNWFNLRRIDAARMGRWVRSLRAQKSGRVRRKRSPPHEAIAAFADACNRGPSRNPRIPSGSGVCATSGIRRDSANLGEISDIVEGDEDEEENHQREA